MTPAESTAARRLSWSNHAPLGKPVVPLVQMITTGSDAEPGCRAGRSRVGCSARGVEVVAAEHGRVGGQSASERPVVDDGQLRLGPLEDGCDLARAEPRVQARGDRAESRHRCVGGRVVDRGGQHDRDDVTGAHAMISEQRGDTFGIVEPCTEGDAPVALDVRLAIAELLAAASIASATVTN